MLSFPCVPYYTVHTRCLKDRSPTSTEITNSRDSEKGPCRDHDEGDDDIGTCSSKFTSSSAFTQTFVGSQRWDTPAERDQEHRGRPNDPHQIARRCEEECEDDRS